MCLLKNGKMASTTFTQSTLERLQYAFLKQNAYYSGQIVKDLTADELEQYLSMRNACVHYIKGSRVFFDTKPEVFATAVGILDVFLWKVKVTEKYMTIVAAACFLLACKITEEDESCPSPCELSSLPFHSWTANDLCRMEMQILKKMNWSLSTVTYLDFLPLLADLYGVNRNIICCDNYMSLAERCILSRSTILFKPLLLAFALFHHATDHLQEVRMYTSNTNFNDLDIKDSEMLECKKVLSDLSSPMHALHTASVPRRSVSFPNKIFDRPSEIGITCLPTISEE